MTTTTSQNQLFWDDTYAFTRCCKQDSGQDASESTVSSNAASQCWDGGFSFDFCCVSPTCGIHNFWDAFFTPRCCGYELPTLCQMGGCELSLYQRFWANAMDWFTKGKLRVCLSFVANDANDIKGLFSEAFVGCAAATVTAWLVKIDMSYYEDNGTWPCQIDQTVTEKIRTKFCQVIAWQMQTRPVHQQKIRLN